MDRSVRGSLDPLNCGDLQTGDKCSLVNHSGDLSGCVICIEIKVIQLAFK